MARIARRRLGRGVYHVYKRGHDGARGLPVQVYHWAIMGKHSHLAAAALAPPAVSGWLPRVCRRYSRWYHRERNGHGDLWQGRFRSVPAARDAYRPRRGRDRERNPVRAGVSGVGQAGDCEWSSARHDAPGAADPLVAADAYFFYLGLGVAADERPRTFRQQRHDERERATDEARFRGPASALGAADFLANLRRVAGHLTARARHRPREARRVQY